jgi:ABC-type dipeptide/oligopeptide/nickel transport system permease component
MLAYTIRRLFGILVMLLLLSMFTFTLSRVVPGGPWMQGAEIPLPDEQVAAFKAKYGLDKPLWQQYLVWLGNAARLDFGRPFTAPELSVTQLIARVLPYSALIGGLAAALATAIGITLGIIAAARQNSWIDTLITSYAVGIATIPSYVMGYILAYLIAAKLGLFPPVGGAGHGTGSCRSSRSGCRPAVGSRAGRANASRRRWPPIMCARLTPKGLSQASVMTRHVLRNAMIPIITSVLPIFPGMMTGSIFIERVFGLPGLGTYFVMSSTNRDYPLVLGITIFWAVLISLTYLLTDILYGVIDPRVRIGEGAR